MIVFAINNMGLAWDFGLAIKTVWVKHIDK